MSHSTMAVCKLGDEGELELDEELDEEVDDEVCCDTSPGMRLPSPPPEPQADSNVVARTMTNKFLAVPNGRVVIAIIVFTTSR